MYIQCIYMYMYVCPAQSIIVHSYDAALCKTYEPDYFLYNVHVRTMCFHVR